MDSVTLGAQLFLAYFVAQALAFMGLGGAGGGLIGNKNRRQEVRSVVVLQFMGRERREMKSRFRMCWLGLVVGTVVTVSAEAALLGRLPATPGGTDYQAAYDDVLDITWVTDASLSGSGTWEEQLAWADGFSLGGAKDWRLASMSVSAGVPTGTTTSVVGCSSSTELACRDNELGYMYYYNLTPSGDTPPTDLNTYLTGDQTVGDVTLTGIQARYWSGTEFDSERAWVFDFGFGIPGSVIASYKYDNYYGWAVRSGDIALVPVPPAVWLFATGLMGLVGAAGRKRRP